MFKSEAYAHQSSSSSPLAFPIIWTHRNGIEYHSSTLSCPVHPPPLKFNPQLSISLLSLSIWFSVFLSVSFLVLVHQHSFVVLCPSSPLLSCPYHFSLFSVIFFVTGATFTDPLTCSFLILSFFVIHRSILILCVPIFK